MRGIVGALVLEVSDLSVTETYATKMREAMVHRGPDGGETWIAGDGRLGLGHRRLSIIDLSTVANRPMSNEHGSIWIAFNGGIRNHAGIRAAREAIGGRINCVEGAPGLRRAHGILCTTSSGVPCRIR